MPRRYRVPIEETLFRTLLLWLINVIALVLAAALLPGVYVTSLGGAARPSRDRP